MVEDLLTDYRKNVSPMYIRHTYNIYNVLAPRLMAFLHELRKTAADDQATADDSCD